MKIKDRLKNRVNKEDFEEISLEDIKNVLELTIKKDDDNKIVTFLAMLSAFTEESQFNLNFNAPSSTGKSYIPLEISTLFPKDDIQKYGYVSPMSFYHKAGTYVEEEKKYILDLSRKILIFTDMPNHQLLERLRPLLSHDEKVLTNQISDRSMKGGLKTKEIEIIGYPVVIFCSANSSFDEQESTRFITVSPDMDQEKIREGILNRVERSANAEDYYAKLNSNKDRQKLIERIRLIKNANIKDVLIEKHVKEEIINHYFSKRNDLKPRHQRDIGRVLSIIKSITLMNFKNRERDKNNIKANIEDARAGLKLWDDIAMPQELNLPPYIFNLYWDVVVPYYQKKQESDSKKGLSRQEICNAHYKRYKRVLDMLKFRQEILPILRSSGLIYEKPDEDDKRTILIYPSIESKDEIYSTINVEPNE